MDYYLIDNVYSSQLLTLYFVGMNLYLMDYLNN